MRNAARFHRILFPDSSGTKNALNYARQPPSFHYSPFLKNRPLIDTSAESLESNENINKIRLSYIRTIK